jgi:hypothetical protein
MLGFSTVFNPVYLAAAYLDRSRKKLEELDQKLVGLFPEEIHGSAWYKYVDPNIKRNELEFVSNCLREEVDFVFGETTTVDNDKEQTSETELKVHLAHSEFMAEETTEDSVSARNITTAM